MFIELTEILRCPNDHEESYLVAVPVQLHERRVIRGGIGCPVCGAEYPIVDGVAHFTDGRTGGPTDGRTEQHRPPDRPTALPPYDAAALQAFIAVEGRGGYVMLAGAAARHAVALAGLLPGVHVCTVNPAPPFVPGEGVSVLISPRGFPLKSQSVRAAVLGADCAGAPWLEEGVRVLLPGLRLVVEDDTAEPERIETLARGAGLLVGEKRAR